ncbi:MAG: hypothetical protein IPO60_02115 [Flavobacteriales bacterium]|nr:hypothetical protein [Flavobacteriales bacterium]
MINIPTPLTTRSGNWSTLFNKLKFQRRKDFLFVLMALPLASPLMAQSPLVPTVEWRMISAEHERAGAGTYNDISFDGTEWVHTPSVDQNYGASQTPEQSGEDWYYGHCNIRSGANVVGILAAGYVTWPNWTFRGATGCASSVTYGGPNIGEFETSNHRKGEGVGYVAKHDLDGHEVWSKCLLPGLLRNAIQDADNNFLVVGNAYTNAWAMDPGDGNNPVIGLNGIAGLDMNDVDCGDFTQPAGTKGYVSKLGSDGHIIWTTMCNGELGTDQETNWNVGSYLTDIVAVTIPGTAIKYCAVGMTTTTGVAGLRPLLVYLDNDGTPVERYTYAPGTPANWSAGNVAGFISIDVQGTDLFITGYSLGSGIPAQAFGMLLHAGTDRFNFPWRHFTADLGDPICNIGLHNPNSTYYTNNSTGGGFVPETGGVHIVWPTMGNFSEGSVYGGSANVATLLVHGLDLDGTLLWTTDLGEVRAYDLQSDMTPTADGKVALVSTKLSGADLTLPSLPISWDDFSPSQKACLNGTFGFANPDLPNTTENEAAGVNWDYDGSTNPESGNDPTGLYHYWNTYAYVAKLDPETGNLIWQTQFDAHPGVPGACPYANMRKQECMYKISETDDGGLVVSGNTSDNFDDFYLAELNDCQTRVNYAGSPALDPNNEHHITSPTTWSSDMNVHGKIIVDPGATLTINNNAVISFADSKQLLDHPTELVVAKGGRLDVNGNARLTSIAQCPNSMWDGIRVMGDSHLSQDPVNNSPQGMASLSASTIENARAALLTGDASFDDPTGTMHGSSAGGYIRASLMTFKNKRYDVVMRKFENRDPHDFSHILNNRSYFDRCAFAEDALLNDGNSPRDHVHLNGVRGINYTGCSFAGVYQPDQVFHGMTQVGTGIRSINSSFSVRSKCTILLSYGQTCPPQNLINSTFDKLGQGVTATALTPDKTFIVDRATFTNCPRGIRTDGVRNAGITRNSFSVVDYLNPNVLGTPFGAYLDQCTGYKIQNNAFTSTGSHQKSRVGLVIKDSGPEYNTFYNNTFDDFISAASVGSLIEGDNANAQADYLTGLEVMCNEYGQFDGPNRFDVALTGQEPTVQRTQGKYLGPSIITAPAGNLFSLEGEAESDWDVSNASNYVTYYSHGHNGSSEPWIPQYYDIDYLLPAVTPVHWPQDRADACPDNFDNDGRLEKMQQSAAADADLADSKDAYDATKDNGDTYTLEAMWRTPDTAPHRCGTPCRAWLPR